MAGNRMRLAHLPQWNVQQCKFYRRFGECQNGPHCQDSHSGKISPVRTFIATFLKAEDWYARNKGSEVHLRVEDRVEVFYVPKGPFYRKGIKELKEGEVLYFQASSEKGFNNLEFGRILELINARCEYCWLFGICQKHLTRNDLGQVVETKFIIAKVLQITTNNSGRKGVCVFMQDGRSCNVPNDKWYCIKKPETEDWILLQMSKKCDGNGTHYGRIVQVLKNYMGGMREIRMHDAFTVNLSFTKHRENAFSIDMCEKHDECFCVGIHIVAAAAHVTGKVDESFLTQFCRKKIMKDVSYFRENDCTLAFSIFFHTKDDDTCVEFSLVRVTECCDWETQEDDSENFKRFLRLLSPTQRRSWVGFDDRLHKCVLQYRELGKPAYLCESLMRRYCEVVRKSCENASFISEKWPMHQLKDTNEVSIFKDEYEAIKGAKNYNDLAVLLVTSRGMRFRKTASDESKTGRMRHELGVHRENHEVIKYRVQCTAPVSDVFPFINQQILQNYLFGSREVLYSDSELLGLMTVRFAKPMLSAALVERIYGEIIVLLHSEVTLHPSLIEIPLHAVGCNEIIEEQKKLVMTYKNLSCKEEDYLNREILRMSNSDFDNLVKSISEIDGGKEFVPDDQIQFETVTAPYIKSGNDTQLHLQPGVEIQIQISNSDAAWTKNGLGLRMLRIGINCNFCLMHTEHPERTFLSRREDIRTKLLTKQRVENLKGRLTSVAQLKCVEITWTDRYYSGGTFETEAPSEENIFDVSNKCASEVANVIKQGDLLCIFEKTKEKELTGFIWNCHGVVSNFENGKATFLNSSLSQNAECEETMFTVEILREESELISSNARCRTSVNSSGRTETASEN